jgi:hypothetical protein
MGHSLANGLGGGGHWRNGRSEVWERQSAFKYGYCSLAYSALACFRLGMSGVVLVATRSGVEGRRSADRSGCCRISDEY